MQKIEHIGIAVKSLSRSIPLFESLLNTNCYKEEQVESESVRTAFFSVGGQKIELLESLVPGSIVEKFINNRGEGIHHIAFEVDDLESEMKRLEEAGFILLNKKPVPGADNKQVCFLHPKNTNGVLVELVTENKKQV